MGKENYNLRHKDIFDVSKQKYKIKILGCGGLGSFIAFNLAKMGISDIEVYDFDKVEEVNIGTQLYRPKDLFRMKTMALKEIVKDFTDIDIKVKNEEVTEKTQFPLELNNIYILTFDTLESRKLVFNKLKDMNCICLDVRAGGEEFNIQVVNTSKQYEVEEWEKSFNIIPDNLPCTGKSIIYTNLIIAGEVCNIVKKLNNSEKYPLKVIRNMKGYNMLVRKGETK